MAPESIEPELQTGLWLLVVFPVWSSPVRDSVVSAVACAKEHNGRFQLGVRPYDSPSEVYKWWPGDKSLTQGKSLLTVTAQPWRREIRISTDPSENPIWLLLRDGQIVDQATGPRSTMELSEMMQEVLGHM